MIPNNLELALLLFVKNFFKANLILFWIL